jgi:hypothetical protein
LISAVIGSNNKLRHDFSRGGWSNRRKQAYFKTTSGVPPDVIDGCVKPAFIGCELLQRPNTATRAYYRNKIDRLHLLVNKLFQRASHIMSALK